jgi:hypothetical protein
VSFPRPRVIRRPGSKLARIEAAVLGEIASLRAANGGRAWTTVRFVFYRLVASAVLAKAEVGKKGGRRPDQDVSVVLSDLRWAGIVGFDEIADRSRTINDFTGWESFAGGAVAAIEAVRLDPWGDPPPPLLVVESESLGGLLEDTAYMYRVLLIPSRGQCSDSLIWEVARLVRAGHRRVIYVGDLDLSGGHIERSLAARVEALSGLELDWRRVALTAEQVQAHSLPVIQKYDKRRKAYFPAVEAEALDQRILLPLIEDTLAGLLPTAELARVERIEQARRRVAAAAVWEALAR